MIQLAIDESQIPLLHGANGKFTANLDVVAPSDPIPESSTAIAAASFTADGSAAFGSDVSLAVSADTSVTLAALFKEQTGAAPDLVKTFGLDDYLDDKNMILALDLGGKADVSASGSYKYNVLSATASLHAGTDARLVNTRVYDDRTQPSGKVLDDFFANLKTPGTTVKPPKPGEMAYLEFGGYLKFAAGLAAGYEIKGTHDFQSVGDLHLSEAYQLSVTGKLNLSAKLSGRFSIKVQSASDQHAGDAGWARVTVNRQRASDLQIAADLSASAEIDTEGLPSTGKEFLGSLLGLRAKNWINQVDSILNQAAGIHTAADLISKLDGLAQTYLSRFIGKAVNQLTPAEVQGLLGKLKKVIDGYNNVSDSAVSLFDRYFDKIDTALKPALAKVEALGSLDEFQGAIDPALWNVIQQLTGGNILDTLLDKATGLKTLQDGADKVLSLIEDPINQDLRDFIALSKKEFDLDHVVSELAKYDSLDKLKAQASDAANHVVERILGKAVAQIDKQDFKNLLRFLQAVAHDEQDFFTHFDAALEEAATQQFTADIGLSYDRSDESTALIDVDIRLQNADGTDNAAGLAFMRSAGLADFSQILKKYDPSVVRLRAGTLTHKLSTSTGVKINIAGWHQSFQYQSIYKVVVNTQQQIRPTSNGMLHVFTNVDLTAGSDKTRKTNKHEQEMHSNFILSFIGESTRATMTPDDRHYVLDVITATSAAYTLKLVDNNTTPDKLNRMLEFASTLGLDKKGATPAALSPILQLKNNTYGPMDARYEVRFSEFGLKRLFSTAVAADDIQTILRKIVMANYLGTGIEPVAWLFCSNTIRDLALGNPNFVDTDMSLSTVQIEIPFPGLTLPSIQTHNQTFRQLALTLFLIADSLIQAFLQLQSDVQRGSATLQSLQDASKSFGKALNDFDSQTDLCQGTSNPLFAVFDHLIQLATPATQARNSALALKIGSPDQPDQQKTILFQLVASAAPAAMHSPI